MTGKQNGTAYALPYICNSTSSIKNMTLQASGVRVLIYKLLKKASSWKKEELTKFKISSNRLSVTRYALSSMLDYKQ